MEKQADGQLEGAQPKAEEAGSKADADASHEGGDNQFQRAIAAWRKISLGTLMPDLDKAASDIVSFQRDSVLQRKELAQKTKDFRKLEDAAKLSEIKGLLKAYQAFIDILTNQSKSTNAAFFQVYSPLSEVPDPYPLLEASVEALVLSEDTLPKVTEENRHLQGTVIGLSAQLDDAEKRLEEERGARRASEEAQDAKIRSVETSWTAVLEEKKDNWESKERSLEEKVENQERLLKELKANYEVTQRLDRAETDQYDDARSGASAAELELVTADLERTTLRLAEIEARNEQLRVELAHAASRSQNAAGPTAVEDDPTFLRIRSENSSLRRKLDATKIEKTSEARAVEAKLRSLERDVALLRDDRDGLRQKMDRWSDYDEIKRELDMLKSIEFATGDDDELEGGDGEATSENAAPDANIVNGTSSRSKTDSLEQLLLARNKKLGDELTVFRVSHNSLREQLQTLRGELSDTTAALDRYRTLSASLENDLVRVQQEASNALPSSALSVAGTHVSRHPQASAAGGRRFRTSPTSSIISGFDPVGGRQPSPAYPGRDGEGAGGGSSILPMVTAQRDRFRQRNAQLEQELSQTYNSVTSLRQEIASLQKDNLALYEKTRYASSFNRGPGAAGATTSSSGYHGAGETNPSTVHASSSAASPAVPDERYRSAYEASISPFAAFRARESVRAYKRMSMPERLVFSVSRIVLATRVGRVVFAAYCLGLHLFIVLLLYRVGTAEVEKHTNRLGETALGPRR